MRQARHRCLAQDQPDVRIGNQEAVAVDDVGFALLADLDARHDVPDELEIDLRDGDRSLVARTDRYRHIRLGLLAEIHRTEPRLPTPGLAKRRLVRAILAGIDAVHPQPRDRDLLASFGIELRDVRHFRRLPQQLEELDAPQFDVVRIELGQCGVGELLLDLADVLLDTRRRTNRLFMLQAGERGLGFLIREVDADRARRKQRDHDQRKNQHQILAKQAAAADAPRRVCDCGGGQRRRRHGFSVAHQRFRAGAGTHERGDVIQSWWRTVPDASAYGQTAPGIPFGWMVTGSPHPHAPAAMAESSSPVPSRPSD